MSSPVTFQMLAFLAAVKAAFIRRVPADDAVGLEMRRVRVELDRLPPATGSFPKSNHEIGRHIRAALQAGNPASAALVRTIVPVIRFLPWRYSYPPRADAPSLGQNIAFAEIVGPAAPFHSDAVCLGLTLIAPRTLYPAHRHPAVELYHVLTGTAAWTLNGVARDNPPGAFILHSSQAVHAMETRDEPLLALYTWSGADVRSPSVYVAPAQPA